MSRFWISLRDRDLGYLVEGTLEFDDYIADLLWAQANREKMMDRVIDQFQRWMSSATGADVTVDEQQRINCHHNFSAKERHWGKEVWVSRKGAISASDGEWGLIPGAMGTASYVVTGLGNALSLNFPRTELGGCTRGLPPGGRSPRTTYRRPWWAPRAGTPTPSSTRSRRRART